MKWITRVTLKRYDTTGLLLFSAFLVPRTKSCTFFYENHETAKAWLKAENEVVQTYQKVDSIEGNNKFFFSATIQNVHITNILVLKEFWVPL